MLKVTSLFLGAFFGFIVVPSYIKADKPTLEIAGGTCNHPPPSSPFPDHELHSHTPLHLTSYHPFLTNTTCRLLKPPSHQPNR